jgi:hypothetical protein
MIPSTDVALLLSGWKDEGATVKGLLIWEDKMTFCIVEGTISELDNARVTIKNARNYMRVNLEGAEFDYGDSREFGPKHENIYSDLVRAVLPSHVHFAIAVLKQKGTT